MRPRFTLVTTEDDGIKYMCDKQLGTDLVKIADFTA